MSLSFGVKTADGAVVLAADSRTTAALSEYPDWYAVDDSAMKIVALPHPHAHVGVTACGNPLPEDAIVAALPSRRLTVREYAALVRDVCTAHGGQYGVLVGGADEGEDACRLYAIEQASEPIELHAGQPGMAWFGARLLLDRFLQGFEPALSHLAGVDDAPAAVVNGMHLKLPMHTFTTEDCIDLARFLVMFVQGIQRFAWKQPKTVGGAVDVAVITPRDGFRWVHKKPAAEPAYAWYRKETWEPLQVAIDTPRDTARVATYSVEEP
jgi:hypothetical protein